MTGHYSLLISLKSIINCSCSETALKFHNYLMFCFIGCQPYYGLITRTYWIWKSLPERKCADISGLFCSKIGNSDLLSVAIIKCLLETY